MPDVNFKWIRPNISLANYDKGSKHLVTLRNSGDLVVDYKKYADCFFGGAERIIHYLAEDAAAKYDIAKLDLWYFSMIYLYRQSLELLLKAAIFKYMSKKEDRLLTIGDIRHDLKHGLDVLLSIVPETVISDDESLIWLSQYFEDISRVDKESDMFRYPFGSSLQKLFEKQTHISLVATHENMNAAYAVLKEILEDGVSTGEHIATYEPKLFVEGGYYCQQSVVGPGYTYGVFHPYFTSYEEVGKFFEELILKENCTEMFLPMCYTFRNAVELGLKMIILEDSHISHDKALQILKRKKHSLLGLWNSIESEIDKYSNAPEGDTTLADAKKYIDTLHDFDCVSDIFRYPTNKKLETYFSPPQTFDMGNVAQCFHELCNFLDAVSSMLSVVRENEAEMRAYYA